MEKIVKGKNISGAERTYSFVLANAETGVRLFHTYAPQVMASFGDLVSSKEDGQVTLMEVAMLVPNLFAWDDIKDISKTLLAGATVEADGKTHEANADGFFDAFASDPVETYVALFHAVVANYPSYLAPFMGTGADQEDDDSTPDSETK